MERLQTANFQQLFLSVTIIIIIFAEVYSEACQYRYFNQFRCVDVTLNPYNFLEVNSTKDVEVKELIFDESVITTIPVGVFTKLENVTFIDLSSVEIQNIEPEAFSEMISLKKLHLGGNKISELKPGSMRSLITLIELDLSNNCFTKIQGYYFSNLTNLEILHLNENYIKILPKDVFHGMFKLQQLLLQNNNIKYIPNTCFKDLSYLIKLDLTDNNLENLDDEIFEGLFRLRELSLKQNKLKITSERIFQTLHNLEYLYISNNYIISLNALKLLTVLPRLEQLYMTEHLSRSELLNITDISENCAEIVPDQNSSFRKIEYQNEVTPLNQDRASNPSTDECEITSIPASAIIAIGVLSVIIIVLGSILFILYRQWRSLTNAYESATSGDVELMYDYIRKQ